MNIARSVLWDHKTLESILLVFIYDLLHDLCWSQIQCFFRTYNPWNSQTKFNQKFFVISFSIQLPSFGLGIPTEMIMECWIQTFQKLFLYRLLVVDILWHSRRIDGVAEVLYVFLGFYFRGNKKVTTQGPNEGVTTHNNGLTPGTTRYSHAHPG